METVEQMQERHAAAIANAGAATEAELREMEAPRPKLPEELVAYIATLTDRPHDYGTCVYAMSLAAVATINYVGSKLGVTGFQASCADIDILRQTRGITHGKLLNYDDLYYPQYCDDEHFPSWESLLRNPKVLGPLAERAKKDIAGFPSPHPDVLAHWKSLVERWERMPAETK